MYHYEFKDDNFILIDNEFEREVWSGTEVAICFDKSCGTLFRHGDPEMVLTYHKKLINIYTNTGFDDIASDCIVLIINKHDDLVHLNRCVDTINYAKSYYTQLIKSV